MALEHDFLLVHTADHVPADYMSLMHEPGSFNVHDDILRYIADSLEWVRTFNPSTNTHQDGLNFYGVTAIMTDGAALAAGVFEAWLALFSLGPDPLMLTGSYVVGKRGSGHYSRDPHSRATVLDGMRRLATSCRAVANSDGRFFLLHFGM